MAWLHGKDSPGYARNEEKGKFETTNNNKTHFFSPLKSYISGDISLSTHTTQQNGDRIKSRANLNLTQLNIYL